MLDLDPLEKHNPNVKEEEIIQNPFFAQQLPLWVKNTSQIDNLCPPQTKRYEYTKIGKTFRCEITRYMSIFKDRLFYFDVKIT